MYRLEHGVRDERKAKEAVPQIAAIQVGSQVVVVAPMTCVTGLVTC